MASLPNLAFLSRLVARTKARRSKHFDDSSLQLERLEERQVLAAGPYDASVLASSTVAAYYEFEETSGTVANDVAGAADNGTYTGGVTLGVPSASTLLQNAAQFDGVDDFVVIPRTIGDGLGSFTIEMWVNTSQGAIGQNDWYGGYGLVDGEVGGATGDFGTSVLNGRFAFGVGNGDTTVVSNTVINDGQWHYVVATRNGVTGEQRVYVDGNLENVAIGPGGARTTPTRLTIGQIQVDTNRFAGLIDEVALHNGILDAATIAARYSLVANDAPVAVNDTAATDADTVLTVPPGQVSGSNTSLLDNDSDPDGDAFTVIASSNSQLGATVTVNPDGTFTYDPTTSSALQALNDGETATDTFTYTIADANDTFTPGNLRVEVYTGGINADLQSALNAQARRTPNATGTVNLLDFDDPSNPVGGERFTVDNEPPGLTAGDDNNYAVFVHGVLRVDVAGYYTFGVHTDDDSAILIDLNQDGVINQDASELVAVLNGASNQDRFGAPVFLSEGTYKFMTVYAEGGGGSGGEFFYAPGEHTAFNSTFRLIGDASGGITAGQGTISQSIATVSVVVTGTSNAPVANDDAYVASEDQVLTVPATAVPGMNVDVYFGGVDARLGTATSMRATGTPTISTTATLADFIDSQGGHAGRFGVNNEVPGSNGAADDNNYALFISGIMQVNASGTYTFGSNTDDASLIWIDLNQDGYVAVDGSEFVAVQNGCCGDIISPPIDLQAGLYQFEAFYTEGGGGSGGDFFYAPGVQGGFNASFVLIGDSSGGIATFASLSGLMVNDTDADTGDSFSVVPGVIQSANGATVTLNADGSFSYDATASVTIQALTSNDELVDTFTYTIIDSEGATGTGTVSVTVRGVSDPAPDVYTVNEDNPGDGVDLSEPTPGVLANDAVLDGVGTVNLALNRPTSESTTYPGTSSGAAVDGDPGTISHTDDATLFNWWQADLGSPTDISQITIFNRVDCCGNRLSDFRISIWNGDPTAGGTQVWGQDYFGSTSVPQGGQFTIGPDEIGDNGLSLDAAVGSFVRIQLNGINNDNGNILTLAEVQVFGAAGSSSEVTAAQGTPLSGSPVTVATDQGGEVVINPDGSLTYDQQGVFDSLAAGETATDTFTYTAENSAISSGVNGATVHVPEANDYTLVYELDIPTAGFFRDGTPVPYSVDNSELVTGDFSRIAYYLELNSASVAGSNTSTGFTVAGGDLIAGATAVVVGNVNAEEGVTTNDVNALTDGQFGDPSVDAANANETVAIHNNTTLTYNLDLIASPDGYDISEVASYSAWRDNGRDAQQYTLRYATIEDPTVFYDYAVVNYNPATGNPANNEVRITNSLGGIMLTNVAAIQFAFAGTENGYVGYREFDVIGTASTGAAAATQWVYVSMDAFTQDIVQIGLPHNRDNPVDFQQVVSNMNVFASAGAGVTTGTGIATGNIEFWPSNYSQGTGLGGIGGDGTVFDYNDTGGNTGAGYGSFQVHNHGAGETILAYNRWGNDPGANIDLGIGNRGTSNPDWTFAQNASSYSLRRLAIFVQQDLPETTVTINIVGQNDDPTITSGNAFSVSEDTTAVTTVTATDVDTSDTHTYSVSGGADQAAFTVDANTGALSFATAPDFEAPTDANADNVYEVIVRVTDNNGGFDEQTILVTVTNENDAPVITSSPAFTATDGVATVGTVTATDADGGPLTFSISGGVDSGLFTMDASTGELSFLSAPDAELPLDSNGDNVYEIVVRVTDNTALFSEQSVTVTVQSTGSSADPFDPFLQALTINGTEGDDLIIIEEQSDGSVRAFMGPAPGGPLTDLGTFTPDQRVFVYANGGNDIVQTNLITLDAVIFGGDGNDRLSGGAGNDLILGGNGNDELSGGASGHDVLIGGLGLDALLDSEAPLASALPDNDLLIGGDLSQADDLTALQDIYESWSTQDGQIGTFVNSGTVIEDAVFDVLKHRTGSGNITWRDGADRFLIDPTAATELNGSPASGPLQVLTTVAPERGGTYIGYLPWLAPNSQIYEDRLPIRVIDTLTNTVVREFDPFPGVSSGASVAVATADLNGDGVDEMIASVSSNGPPEVAVFDGVSGAVISRFLAYDSGFRGGVNVATGDVDGDGYVDIITAAGAGGGPHVKVFSGLTGGVVRSYFAYDAAFAGGVFVASGDVNHDGFDDIITGAGAGGGPHVQVFDGRTGNVLQSFFAYDPGFTGGVRVASGDVNNDVFADVITAAGAGGGPHIQVFDGQTGAAIQSYFAYDPGFTGGVWVATGQVDSDGHADVITGPGASGGPHLRAFAGLNGAIVAEHMVYSPGSTAGVRVTSNAFPLGSPLRVAGGPGSGGLVLNAEDLASAVQLATTAWQDMGLSSQALQQLSRIRVGIADLPGDLLGVTSGTFVTIDSDAAGHGWTLPGQTSETLVDLMTVLGHEFGHVLGLEHALDSDDLMAGSLKPGVKKFD